MSGFKKGDRVFWWFKNGRAYSSAVSGVVRQEGTITRVRTGRGRFHAEIKADDDPGRTLTLTTYILHKV